MQVYRTRIAKDIVTEFLPSARRSSRVVVLAGGMPTVPSQKMLINFLSKQGFWVFFPRYRGTWESGGKFLRYSPEKDIEDVISAIPRGIRALWEGRRYKILPQSLYIIGSSFGGAASILLSGDKRVTKSLALSPVVDWRTANKTEPLNWLRQTTKEAFGEGYRFANKDWHKLKNGKFYNPATAENKVDGHKLKIIHARDDNVVDWHAVEKFSQKTKAELTLLKKGGHLGLRDVMRPQFYRRFQKFIAKKP